MSHDDTFAPPPPEQVGCSFEYMVQSRWFLCISLNAWDLEELKSIVSKFVQHMAWFDFKKVRWSGVMRRYFIKFRECYDIDEDWNLPPLWRSSPLKTKKLFWK